MSKQAGTTRVKKAAATLRAALKPEHMEAARLAVEDELIRRRDARISVLRNNGGVCREKDGSDSHIIRMTNEDILWVALGALVNFS